LTIAGSRHPAVDADLDRLLEREEVVDLLGQRARAADDAQRAVAVEPLHHGEVVVEGLVQLARCDRGDVADAVRAGEQGGDAAGDDEAFVAARAAAGGQHHRHFGRARLHDGEPIGC
jgi:hypothetical protein